MQDALITLTGNVGGEVEFSQGPQWALARFRLACTPRRLRQGTWVDQETTWIQVNAWGRLAENLKVSLSKGDPVVVQGKLRTSAWTGQDGVRHERLVVEASTLGHDLSRGRSEFVRQERRALLDDAGERRALLDDAGERRAFLDDQGERRVLVDDQGDCVDASTGEVLGAGAAPPVDPAADGDAGQEPARPAVVAA